MFAAFPVVSELFHFNVGTGVGVVGIDGVR